MAKRQKKYAQVVVRLDVAALAALATIEKDIDHGTVGVRSTAIRRAIFNEAERILRAS
jgi:hypothetical protein